MKVLYDHQAFYSQKIGGVSRYFYELISSVETNYSANTAIKFHKNIYIRNAEASIPFLGEPPVFLEEKNDILSSVKRKLIPNHSLAINKNFVLDQIVNFKPDIFHPTYYDDYFLKKIGDIPFVLTIYDMIHEIYPEHFPGDSRTFSLKKKLFLSANQIIAISETTKKDIMEIYDIPGNKISVVPLANSLTNTNMKFKSKHLNFKKYILFIGARGKYKNFILFIASIAKLLKADPDLKVICAGQKFNKFELDYFDSLGLKSKFYSFFASDDELAFLYSNAEMFVFPSLYEGFGLPVLESFACGCPALLSNSGSLPEVGGDAAKFFDPKSAAEIRHLVEKVMYNSTLKNDMIQKGYDRLNLFSWSKTVKKTGLVYEKCI